MGRNKNPFYWKTPKMSQFDREIAWKNTQAMRRMGQKRFFELFDTRFNGKIVLIVPKDPRRITLADLFVMWKEDIRIGRCLWKRKGDVWCVGGQLENTYARKEWIKVQDTIKQKKRKR